MPRWIVVPLVTVALFSAACSQTPDTIVVGSDGLAEAVAVTTSVPAQRPEDEPTSTPIREKTEAQAEPEKEAQVEPESEPIEPPDEPVPSWQNQPLAHVVLTADDLSALGLDSGWEFNWVDFIELDVADHTDEEVCEAAVPVQPSYFVASFDAEALGAELQLNVMPAMGGTAASDYIHILELVATCPDIRDELKAVSVEILAIDVEGAEQSLVIEGTDSSSPGEPIGLTLAAAEVDGHLFITFVEQYSGTPASGDAELAVKALELSISRL